MFRTIRSFAGSALTQSVRVAATWAPKDLRRLLRFAYRLPVHYAEDLSYQRSCENRLGMAVLCPADGIQIVLPSDRIAHSVFESFFFERESAREWKAFLALAAGCRSFADVGASGGVFSCLFAASRPDGEILSIEPDPPSVAVLHDVRALNSRPEIKRWLIDPRAVSDLRSTTAFISNGYGAEVIRSDGNELSREFAKSNRREAREVTVEADRFDSICESHGFRPDIVKIDIESYEYELIVSALPFLEKVKPRLHLELHLSILRLRGLDPRHPLKLLEKVGYRRQFSKAGETLSELVDQAGSSDVVRLELLCG